MSQFILIHNLVNPETGKTYKQENLEKQHAIPIGTLVDVTWQSWLGEGACWRVQARLWVVLHERDCDGTPLYTVSRWKDPAFGKIHDAHNGLSEDALTPVTITPEVAKGENAGLPGWWVESEE